MLTLSLVGGKKMERVLRLVTVCLALFGFCVDKTWGVGLLSPSKLKMFVDELPDMPRISGFQVVNGVSVPKSLKIGMFCKKWVSTANSHLS